MIDNLEEVLIALPIETADAIRAELATGQRGALIEIVMDLGRRPEARFQSSECFLSIPMSRARTCSTWSSGSASSATTTAPGSSARCIASRPSATARATIVGLTCRVGRAVYGTIAIIRDLVESGESILLLGRPGVGKTTMLREMARVLADDCASGSSSSIPATRSPATATFRIPAIGRARRMQVPTPTLQHAVMIEAVENHMPEVIVIDEIGTELEALAARTIAERGVQLIGTAHGNTLENLMMNPTLSDLIGGIQSVTLV